MFWGISWKRSLVWSYFTEIVEWGLAVLRRQHFTTGVFLRIFRSFQNYYSGEYLWTVAFVIGLYFRYLHILKFISIYQSKSHDCSQVYIMSLAMSYYWTLDIGYWTHNFLIIWRVWHVGTCASSNFIGT